MIQTRSILSTSVLKQSIRTQAANAYLQIDEVDFITVIPTEFVLYDIHSILIFTSQNAVKSVLQHPLISKLINVPCLCVGKHTKELLQAHGFTVLHFTHYAKDLAQVITEKYAQESFTFFSGNIRSSILPQTFIQNDIIYNEITVYHTSILPTQVNKKYDGICFYSPSAVKSYLQDNGLTNEVCFCIGQTTADALKGISQRIVLAPYPSIAQTILTCINYYQSAPDTNGV